MLDIEKGYHQVSVIFLDLEYSVRNIEKYRKESDGQHVTLSKVVSHFSMRRQSIKNLMKNIA